MIYIIDKKTHKSFFCTVSNWKAITKFLNGILAEVWGSMFVTSQVENDAGANDEQEIFITQHIFKRRL